MAVLIAITIEAICLASAVVGLRTFLPTYWPLILPAGWGVGWVILRLVRSPSSLKGAPAEPLADIDLSGRLMEFARAKADVQVRLYRLHGRDRTRRCAIAIAGSRDGLVVYFSDGALEQLSQREILAAFAHELGHAVTGGLLTMAIGALWRIGLITGLYFALNAPDFPEYKADAVGKFLTAFTVSSATAWVWLFAFLPIRNALLRREERLSSEWALRATGDPEAFISAVRKISAGNANESPARGITRIFFHAHPSLDEISDLCRLFAADKRNDSHLRDAS